MAVDIYQVTEYEVQSNGIQGVNGDSLEGSSEENKKRFDQLCTLLIGKYNKAIEYLENSIRTSSSTSANNLAQALSELNSDIARQVNDIYVTINENKAMCDANAELTRQLETRIDNEMTRVAITYGSAAPSPSMGKDGDIYLQIVR